MATQPIVPPSTLNGGELVVDDVSDVLRLLPDDVRNSLSAPVRDALANALLAIIEQYQTRSTQGAALGDILRTSGSMLDGIAADYDRYRKASESDGSLIARCLSLDEMVTPAAIVDSVNIILSSFTGVQARYFESEQDCWYVHDGGSHAYDAFTFTDGTGASPLYPDRLYPDDSAVNSGISIANREVLGTWVFGDEIGRYFILRLPLATDEVYAAIVALVELIKGQGMRWQAIYDPLLPSSPLLRIGNLAFYDLGHLALGT